MYIYLHFIGNAITQVLKVAFVLANSVSDVDNSGCLGFCVSWNKNPKNDRSVSFISK